MRVDETKEDSTKQEPEQIPEELPQEARSRRILAGYHLPYGTFQGVVKPFDFYAADMGLLPFGENSSELLALSKISGLSGQGCEAKYDSSLEEVARKILKRETRFDLSKYNIQTSAGGARQALINIFMNLLTGKKDSVAYASPNWAFDEVVPLSGAKPSPFYAHSADMFVDSFAKLPNLESLSSLIVVDPSNPLGYRLTKEHISALEDIADKHGVTLVFDDVFRGMQSKGDRHSAAEYSTRGIVVETTSKRFGARGIGATWSLIPKDIGIDFPQTLIDCEGCSAMAAAITDSLYDAKYGEKIRNYLIRNTQAFMLGVNEVFADRDKNERGKFSSGFLGMPIITYTLPYGRYSKLEELHSLFPALGVTSGLEWISKVPGYVPSEDEIGLGSSYIRICPTKESADRAYFAGMVIADSVNNYLDKTSSYPLFVGKSRELI